MPSVREILKMNNLTLDISEAALDLEFEGDFIFTGTAQEQKADIVNHPDEFALAFLFYDGENRLMIVPDDQDYVVNYTRYYDDGSCYFEAYDSEGLISMNT